MTINDKLYILGWVVLGILMFITSLFIAMFPRELPEAIERRRKNLKAKFDVVRETRRESHGVLSLPDNPSDLAKIGSQIIFPPENSGDSPLPKFSGKISSKPCFETNNLKFSKRFSRRGNCSESTFKE